MINDLFFDTHLSYFQDRHNCGDYLITNGT